LNQENEVHRLIGAAEEDLQAVGELMQGRHYRIAVSRAYYATFYAASAALLDRDLQFSKHSAVIARFGREFVKDGPFDKEMFRTLNRAFALRGKGDYGLTSIDAEEAEALLADARKFVANVRAMLVKQGYDFDDAG